MAKLLFKAHCTPSAYFNRIRKHNNDVSEGSKSKEIARRMILGRLVIFYANGIRRIMNVDIKEQEQYDSQILRFAHASILIQGPVGDKNGCYVDATKNPVEVWIYGMKLEEFVKKYKHLLKSGQVDVDYFTGQHLKQTVETQNERNVRLFGRPANSSHLPNKYFQ